MEQVAEQLNVGAPQIRALIRTGELRGFQIGGRGLWRIGKDDVENYIADAYNQTAKRVASAVLVESGQTSTDEAADEL